MIPDYYIVPAGTVITGRTPVSQLYKAVTQKVVVFRYDEAIRVNGGTDMDTLFFKFDEPILINRSTMEAAFDLDDPPRQVKFDGMWVRRKNIIQTDKKSLEHLDLDALMPVGEQDRYPE